MTSSAYSCIRWFVELLESNGSKFIACLACLIFFIGLAFSILRGDDLPYIDEVDYHAIATNLVTKHFFSNDGIEPNCDRAPVHPFVLAIFIALGAEVHHLRMVQFFFFALTIWLVYLLVRHMAKSSSQRPTLAATLAALLVVGYPVLFYSASTLFPQTLGGFLFVLFLYLFATATSRFQFLAAGAIYGLLMLTIPMFIFTLVVLIAWIAAVKQEFRWRSLTMLWVGCFAVVSCWTIRNYVVFHSFVLLTSSSGAGLLWGNSPDATIGGAEVDYLIDAYDQSAELNQVEADKYKFRLAVEQMRHRKLAVFGFYCLKVVNHFSFVNDHYAKSEMTIWKDVLMAVTYCPLLALFVTRLVYWRRYRPSAFGILLIASYIFAAFAYAIFHTRIRYRLPYEYAMIGVVALFVEQWLSTHVASRLANGEDRNQG